MSALLEAGFERWWSLYPRKRGSKPGAKRTWIKKRLAMRENELIEILEQQIAMDAQWRDKQFIPYPTTYLNQERWNDEIDIGSSEQPETARERAQRELAEWERSNSGTVLGSNDGNVSGGLVVNVRSGAD